MGLHVSLALRQDDSAEDDMRGVLALDDVPGGNPDEAPLAAGQDVAVAEADHRVLVEEDVRHAFVRPIGRGEEIPAVFPGVHLDAREQVVGAYPETAQGVFRHGDGVEIGGVAPDIHRIGFFGGDVVGVDALVGGNPQKPPGVDEDIPDVQPVQLSGSDGPDGPGPRIEHVDTFGVPDVKESAF